MNLIVLTGNLTKNPVTANRKGFTVTNFDIAVNNTRDKTKPAMFVRATAWGKAGETIAKYATKGSKIMLMGEASVHAYTSNTGEPKAQMEINVSGFEFLRGAGDEAKATVTATATAMAAAGDPYNVPVTTTEYTDVTDEEDLPF